MLWISLYIIYIYVYIYIDHIYMIHVYMGKALSHALAGPDHGINLPRMYFCLALVYVSVTFAVCDLPAIILPFATRLGTSRQASQLVRAEALQTE